LGTPIFDRFSDGYSGQIAAWPALINVTELAAEALEASDMTRFLQTLDMCPLRANVTRLLSVCKTGTYLSVISFAAIFFFPRAVFRFLLY
jgi:hypothetical protein